MITYIDNRLDNKYDLAKPAFSKYGWTYPNFYVRIEYLDR